MSTLKAGFLTLAFSFISVTSFAQLDAVADVLKGGVDDANIILTEYMKPFGEGFGASMNTGWVSSGRPHKMLGFYVRVGAGIATVPSDMESFNASALSGLTNLQLASGSATETPTISGSDSGPTASFETIQQIAGQPLANFDMPSGVGLSFVPAPVIQAGVGLIKGTELSLRFIPSTNIDVGGTSLGQIGMMGFGIRHELNQWLPGGKVIPVNISVQGAWSNLNMVYDNISLRPGDGSNPGGIYDDQEFEFDVSAWNLNLIVGKNIPLIGVYAGVGVEGATTNFGMYGTYPIATEAGGVSVVENFEDPIDIEIEGANRIRALVGARVRVAVLALNVEYTQATYSTLNFGVGISFR